MKWFASTMREQIQRVSVDSCSKTKKATITPHSLSSLARFIFCLRSRCCGGISFAPNFAFSSERQTLIGAVERLAIGS
jgi:hypothetical protein